MKVLIVDDDNLVAMSLRTILSSDSEIEVVATGNSGEDAIRLYDEYLPDVLLMLLASSSTLRRLRKSSSRTMSC